MPTEAIKIPQNVQIEDKIVGPLSLRQIIIIALGGGFSYVIYAAVQKSLGHVNIPLTVIIWMPAAIAAAFAMVNINDLSLTRILFLLLERMQKPGLRTWAPRAGISINIRTSAIKEEKPAEAARQAVSTQQQIAHLSSVVDQATPASLETVSPPATERTGDPAGRPDPVSENPPPAVRPPVEPDRIQVDIPHAPAKAQLSDLSVFRDIFPPTTTWQS